MNSRRGLMNLEVFSAEPVDEDAMNMMDAQARKGA